MRSVPGLRFGLLLRRPPREDPRPGRNAIALPSHPTAVTCRRWNWRQSRRTQLTEATTSAFFIFDRLDGLAIDEPHAAVDELERLLLDRWPDCHLDRLERHAL
jgi:DNA/RNA-binding domain of Phe-tRNA-synthetase-like protein